MRIPRFFNNKLFIVCFFLYVSLDSAYKLTHNYLNTETFHKKKTMEEEYKKKKKKQKMSLNLYILGLLLRFELKK